MKPYLSFSWVCCTIRLLLFFFFFSSRRRHTRFDCDWSSDVCSSDLPPRARGSAPRGRRGPGGRPSPPPASDPPRPSGSRCRRRRSRPLPVCRAPGTRSEEHTSELQSQSNLVCRLLLEKKKRTRDKSV